MDMAISSYLSRGCRVAVLFLAGFATASAGNDPPPVMPCAGDVASVASSIVDARRREMPATDLAPRSVDEVRRRLATMRRADQDIRSLAADLMSRCGMAPESDAMRPVWAAGRAIDAANQRVLKRLLDTRGWPFISRYGEEADQSAFLIAQHATRDRALQKRVLDILARALPRKETSGENYALLFDRIRIEEGTPQRYGSQGHCQGPAWVPEPIERPAEVDRLRASVGLPPLAAYVAQVRQMYCPADPST